MFAASAAMGAIGAEGTEEQIEILYNYGLDIGFGFQIADDILDISASCEELGKTPGKDADAGKITHPSIVGLDESKRIAEQSVENAVMKLDGFGPEADVLRQLAVELLQRTR